MKRFSAAVGVILILLQFGTLAFGQKASGQSPVSVVKVSQLLHRISSPSDTTYIFNFFATWCAPCMEEFSRFQHIEQRFPGQKVKVIFASLDFRNTYKKTLLPMLKKRAVTEEVLLIDETDYNSWIDKIDTGWEGNLPATLVVNNGTHFHTMLPREVDIPTLDSTITLSFR